ncbi:MAG: guanylate kinase [Oscillospiraceae bacterium]|nr:guanylate kinase [Oscillospiraceae bacterium]
MATKGLLIVLSGPSGSGKDSLLQQVIANGEDIALSVSLTTRDPRPSELDGVHYHFTTHEQFEQKLANGTILEHTIYNGQYYGTPKDAVDAQLAAGKTVVLEIEVEGAANIAAQYPDCVRVFLVPPSLAVLRQRLIDRKTNTPEDIERRIAIAKQELTHAPGFDYIIRNCVLADAATDFQAIIQAEKLKDKNILLEVMNDA